MAPMRNRYAVARLAIAATVAAALASTTFSTPAQADTHGDALKAFDEGRKLRETDAEKAAHAFERSIELEPSIGAYYNLGQVNEQLNRLHEAVEAFRKAEKLAVQKLDPRNKDARDAWGKILDTHDYVVLRVSDEIKVAPGLKITVDGVPVADAELNAEVFRPASTHEVVVSATGRKDLRLQALPNKQPVVITLGIVAADPTTTPPPPPDATSSGGGWGWQKWTGTGLAVVGVAGIAYSLISVISYANKESSLGATRNDATARCHGTGVGPMPITSCDDPSRLGAANAAAIAYNDNEQSAKDGKPLWIGLGVGGVVLLAGGIVLFATAPSRSSEPPPPASGVHVHVIPTAGLHDTGLNVVGTF